MSSIIYFFEGSIELSVYSLKEDAIMDYFLKGFIPNKIGRIIQMRRVTNINLLLKVNLPKP